jgi:hypothetical protein
MTSQEISAWVMYWLRDLAVFLALGLLVIWIIPRPLNRWSENVRRAPLKSFGLGIFVLIVGYIGIFIMFALVLALGLFLYAIKFSGLGGIMIGVGLPATAVVFGALSVFVAFISKIVVAFLFGKLLFERFYTKALAHNIWPLLLGLVIYLLIRAIPWLGWAFGSVVTLVGLGAIWMGLTRSKVLAGAEAEATLERSPAVEENELASSPAEAAQEDMAVAPPDQPVEPLESVVPEAPVIPDSLDAEVQAAASDEQFDPDPQSGD